MTTQAIRAALLAMAQVSDRIQHLDPYDFPILISRLLQFVDALSRMGLRTVITMLFDEQCHSAVDVGRSGWGMFDVSGPMSEAEA